jgi:hypothetical protein
MPRRTWVPALAYFALLVGVVRFAFIWPWPERDLGQECLDRVRLGLNWEEAEVVLAEHGSPPWRGGSETGQRGMVYR